MHVSAYLCNRRVNRIGMMEVWRQALQRSNLLWHFLELPVGPEEERRFVATGHIVCFDCDLCEEQGDVRFTDAMPAPWREFYGDCTDAQDEDDAGDGAG